MTQKKIELRDWWQKETSSLFQFMAWWFNSHLEDPRNFPLTLREGDWDEQYTLFMASQEEEE